MKVFCACAAWSGRGFMLGKVIRNSRTWKAIVTTMPTRSGVLLCGVNS